MLDGVGADDRLTVLGLEVDPVREALGFGPVADKGGDDTEMSWWVTLTVFVGSDGVGFSLDVVIAAAIARCDGVLNLRADPSRAPPTEVDSRDPAVGRDGGAAGKEDDP